MCSAKGPCCRVIKADGTLKVLNTHSAACHAHCCIGHCKFERYLDIHWAVAKSTGNLSLYFFSKQAVWHSWNSLCTATLLLQHSCPRIAHCGHYSWSCLLHNCHVMITISSHALRLAFDSLHHHHHHHHHHHQFTPKGFKTWKAKSWIVQSYAIIVKTWKHGVAKNLACQVLNKKVFRFWKLVYQVLTIIFFWSCLGRPSHEDHNSFLGLSLKFGTPKGSIPSLE